MMRRVFGAGKQAAHAFGHRLLGGGETGALGVGGIGQQRQHAAAAVLSNGGKVGDGVARKRRVVDLEVAGVQHDAGRALDREGERVRDAVVDMDRFDRKAAELDFLARADLVEDGAGSKAVLLELVLDQTDGQAGRINRHIELFEQVGQRANVVLVPVGDEQALDAVLIFEHIGEVGDHEVDAEHLFVREDEAAVDKDHVAPGIRTA